MTDPLPPGSVIGILGGGQLGRMLSMAAAQIGLRCHIFCPEADPPAGQVAERVTVARYDDGAALDAFAEAVDAVTCEFENVPASALVRLSRERPVRPGPRSFRGGTGPMRREGFPERHWRRNRALEVRGQPQRTSNRLPQRPWEAEF